MTGLRERVAQSLRVEFGDVQSLSDDVLLCREPAADPTASHRVVVMVSEDDHTPEQTDALVETLEYVVTQHTPQETYWVLHHPMKGINNDQRNRVAQIGVTRQSPLMFFDRYYRGLSDGGDGKVYQSILRDNRDLPKQRVDQRFEVLRGERQQGSSDVVRHLVERPPPERATLTLVTGPAGAGKTIANTTLFLQLYDAFHAKKKAMADRWARPLLFLPEMLAQQQAYTFDGLLQAFLATDGAANVHPDHLDWLHREGFVLVMLDGLDEILARQHDIFEVLGQNLTAEGSRAWVVLCMRDGLIATHDGLRRFVEEQDAGPACVEELRLQPWNAQDRHALFGIRTAAWVQELARLREDPDDAALDEDGVPLPPQFPAELIPAVGSEDTVRAELEATIEARPRLVPLLTTPFYCEVIAEAFLRGRQFGVTLPEDPNEILYHALVELILRERDKLGYREHAALAQSVEGDPLGIFMTPTLRAAMAAHRDYAPPLPNPLRGPASVAREQRVQGLLFVAGAAAHEARVTNGGTAIAAARLAEILVRELGPEVQTDGPRFDKAVLAFTHLAVFQSGAGAGSLMFRHEIVADFLAGRHATRRLAEALAPTGFWRRRASAAIYGSPDVLPQILGHAEPSPALCDSVRWHLEAPTLGLTVRRARAFAARAAPRPSVSTLRAILGRLAM